MLLPQLAAAAGEDIARVTLPQLPEVLAVVVVLVVLQSLLARLERQGREMLAAMVILARCMKQVVAVARGQLGEIIPQTNPVPVARVQP